MEGKILVKCMHLKNVFLGNSPLPKLIIVDTTRRERVRITGGIAKVVGVGTNIAAAQVAAVVEVLSPIGWLPRQRYTGGTILNRVKKGGSRLVIESLAIRGIQFRYAFCHVRQILAIFCW